MRLIPLAIVLILLPTPTFAWNGTGHKVIATIAYRQLDPQTRQKIAELLKKHPAYVDLWAVHADNGGNAALSLFWDASIFPDVARREPWKKYDRSTEHYVNFRIMAEEGNKVEPPLDGENVLNSYVAHVRSMTDPKTSDTDKALHLSWIFHQAGDIHQPLHAVARFSKAIPEGDRGGNEVGFPSARGIGNLHSYWDSLLGRAEDPAELEKLADAIVAEHPKDGLAAELAKMNISDWAQESVSLSLSTVYRNLDPNIRRFADRPIGYEADAVRVARKRIALAGYRLGEELRRAVNPGK